MREAMAQHRANPACASCHARMDPIGFAMENFDAVGQWRDQDRGQAHRCLRHVAGRHRSSTAWPAEATGPARSRAVRRHGDRETADVRRSAAMCSITMQPAVRAIVRDAAANNYTFRVAGPGRGEERSVSDESERKLKQKAEGRSHDVHHQESLAAPDLPAGHGRAVALPMLDSMIPALSAQTVKPPPRLGFVYVSHGVIFDQWKPTKIGTGLRAHAQS